MNTDSKLAQINFIHHEAANELAVSALFPSARRAVPRDCICQPAMATATG